MSTTNRRSFFQGRKSTKPTEIVIDALTCELNTAVSDLEVGDKQLSGGQNVTPASDTSLTKRDGTSLFGPFLGPLPVTGGFNYVNTANGTQRQLVCYNTGVNIHTATTSTPISGLTLTQGVQCDGVYFESTDKFYITNGTDTVAVIANDGTGAQSNSLPTGKFITEFLGHILIADNNVVTYTDALLDTITDPTNQTINVDAAITGLISYYSKLLIFTKRKIWRLENFTFDATTGYSVNLFPLPVEFGSIIENTIKVVNGYVYFLGQDMNSVAAVYQCDGYTATNISENKILNTVRNLSGSELVKACAVADGVIYRVFVSESGQGTNNVSIVYDTVRQYFYPVERRFIAGLSDFSCLWSSENQGVWTVYAGTSGTGQVMQLHANAGLYDELPEESDLQAGNADLALDANPAKRVGEKFQLHNYDTTNNGVVVTQFAFQIKKNAGTTTGLTLRIETDNNGLPSGTLANANATVAIPAITSTSYAWIMGKFSIAPPLTGTTTYHAVLKHTTEATGDSQYLVNSNSAGTYSYGNAETYAVTTSSVTNSYNPDFDRQNFSVGYTTGAGGTSLASLRSQTTATTLYNPPFLFLQSANGSTTNFNNLTRCPVIFDTTTLPAGATITSAKIRLYVTSASDQMSQSVNLTTVSCATTVAVGTADYNLSRYGSTRLSSDKSVLSLGVNAYNDFTLNSTGIANINAAGYSEFALRLSADIDNSAPTVISSLGEQTVVYFQGASYTNKPILQVTYSVGGGTASWISVPASDLIFSAWVQSPIDAYADTKAYLPVEGKELKVIKFQSIFSLIGNYSAEIGFEISNSPGSFRTFLVPLSQGGVPGKWDDMVSKWDDGITVWDGTATRSLGWTDIGSLVTRVVKNRVRNRNANQNFEFNKIILETYPRMRNV